MSGLRLLSQCSIDLLRRPIRAASMASRLRQQRFDYFLIIDFEATCDAAFEVDASKQEIIEFPCLKVSSRTFEVESTFHRYVRPVVRPELSSFCTQLTGITQGMVATEEPFGEVLSAFDEWRAEERLREDACAVVTCGDWDLHSMLPRQCALSQLAVPSVLRRWINLKRPFRDVVGRWPKGMIAMLNALSLPLQGRHHSGIDDAQNMARILATLAHKYGYVFEITSRIPEHSADDSGDHSHVLAQFT